MAKTSRPAPAVSDPVSELQHELEQFREHWWWFSLLGALLIIGGIVALAVPFYTSVSVVFILGIILLVSGIAMIITAFWTGTWSGFLIQLLIGILYTVVGYAVMEAPVASTAALTLLIGSIFIVAGIFRMVAAIVMRFPQWGWVLLTGALSLILGIMVYKQFSAEPGSAMILIGVLFGIDLVFTGVTWVMLGFDVRNVEAAD
jgi:uncharacterized membrane protein HdeD (DUF308 family)